MNRDLDRSILVLRSPNQNFAAITNALKKLLELDNQGNDIQSSINDVIKVLPLQCHIIKKLSCVLISRLADKVSGASLLVQNTLSGDLRDPNPLVRSLALKTLCSCAHDIQDAVEAVSVALGDESAYVRRAAVMGCVRLHRRSGATAAGGWIDDVVHRLYEMIRDNDSLVVGNSLTALDEILRSEGGMVVNRKIARYLAGRLTGLNEWTLVQAATTLQRYKPQSEDELFELLNAVDPFLRHANCAVVVATTRLFVNLVSGETAAAFPRDLRADVYGRICRRLSFALGHAANPELVQLVLDFVESQLDADHGLQTSVFAPLTRSLLCKYGEPDTIKVGKIRLLARVSQSDTVPRVLDEIGMYCTSSSPRVSKAAIEAVRRMAELDAFERCLSWLLRLLTLERTAITAQVLTVMQEMDLRQLSDGQGLSAALQECSRHVKVGDAAVAPLIWILGEHGADVPDAPYILERFVNEFDGLENAAVKLELELATLKLFFRRPAECQPVLGRLLERCHRDEDTGLREHTVFYCNLLSRDIDLAKRIILSVNTSKTEAILS